jgi:hypothetical protein
MNKRTQTAIRDSAPTVTLQRPRGVRVSGSGAVGETTQVSVASGFGRTLATRGAEMRKILICAFFLCLPCSNCFGQTWNTLPVDYLLNMNTSSPGTQLTSTILSNGGLINSNSSISWANPATAFTVGANQGNCNNLGPVTVNGTTYPTQSLGYNNVEYNESNPFTTAVGTFSGTAIIATEISALVCMTIGPPYQTGIGDDYDKFLLWDGQLGNGYVVGPQIAMGGGCGVAEPTNFECARLEVKPTAHSGQFNLLVGGTCYYFTSYWNLTTGIALMHTYTCDGTPIPCTDIAGTGGTASTNPASPQYVNGYDGNGCATLVGNGSNIAADVIANQTAVVGGNTNAKWNQIFLGNNEKNSFNANSFFQNAMVNWTSGKFPLFWTDSDPFANVVAPPRRVSWSQSGVTGGIPTNRTQCVTTACNTVVTNGSSSTTSQIDSAIDSAPANTYVFLPAGTYNAGFSFRGASNVTVRGAGANQTILRPTTVATGNGMGAGVLINSGDANNPRGTISNPSGCSYINNSACAAVALTVPVKGATTISLTANCCINLKVGNPLFIDQVDSSTDTGTVLVNAMSSSYTGPFTSPGNAGPYSTEGSSSYGRGQNASGSGCSAPSSCYSQQQVVTVTQCDGNTTIGHSCTSGSNITISPPLEMPNWTGTMYAWWATTPALNDGVEDLQVDVSNLQSTGPCGNQSGSCAIGVFNASNSWVKGVSVVNTGGEALIRILLSDHISVLNSYAFLNINSSTSSYGIEVIGTCDSLIEDNIVQAVATPLQLGGPSCGTVFGYNYTINDWYTASLQYNIPAGGDHSAGESLTLREGNISNGHTNDNVHGTGNLNTDFRNAFIGTQPACATNATTYSSTTWGSCTQNYEPETILAYHRFFNAIGNVLGTTGVHTTYQTTTWPSGGTTPYVFAYQGTGNGLQSNTGTDTNTGATLVRWGNVDPVTGFNSPRWNCSELPTAWTTGSGNVTPFDAARLYNPCPLNHTLPASGYYSAKPSWWPAAKPWPPIGPDVASGNVIQCSSGTYTYALVTNVSQCTGGTGSTYANGTVNSNPAMDCYFSLGGLPNGTGPALTNFNENSCYGGSATAVTFSVLGSPSNGCHTTNASSLICNLTGIVSGTNLAGIAHAAWGNSTGSITMSSVSWCSAPNGGGTCAAMSPAAVATCYQNDCGQIFTLANPATGTPSIVFTLSATETYDIFGDGFTATNVNQSTPIRSGSCSGVTNNMVSPLTLTIASEPGDMITSIFYNQTGSQTTNQTLLSSNGSGARLGFGTDYGAGASSVSDTWTGGTSGPEGIAGCSIMPQ